MELRVRRGERSRGCRAGAASIDTLGILGVLGVLGALLGIVVGGATKTHPRAKVALKILGVKSAQELAEIAVAVGLAQNMGALRALATEGIQRGHMALHARNIALVAGATGDEVEAVAKRLAAEHDVRTDRALEVLQDLRAGA